MAIPAVNMSYVGQGPAANGEYIAASNESGPASKYLVGYGTATLDGASTSFTANFVDGTVTPFGTWTGSGAGQSFTAAKPAIIDGYRLAAGLSGTADTAAASVTAVVSAVSTTGCTITISGADTNGHTLSFAVEIYPYLS